MCGNGQDYASHLRLRRPAPRPEGRGGIRHITPATVTAALALVRDGTMVPLNLPLDTPTVGRPNLVHHARMHNQTRPIAGGRFNVVNDDTVDLALQSHSHWDALAHWGVIEPDRPGVFFDGTGLEETYPEFGAKTLGIGTLAGGIVTRAVLFDMVEHLGGDAATHLPTGTNIGIEAVESWLARRDLQLRPGDAAIFYTGFQYRLLEYPGCWQRGSPAYDPSAAGLLAETLPIFERAATFALVADNPSVEPNPMGEGPLHRGALKHLGIYLGELFALDDLVLRCRAADRWEFAFVSMPLNIPRAFGSPANALAIL